MERAAWTDERLDDLAEGMRSGFARGDGDFRDLRGEMRQEFALVRGEIRDLRGTMNRFGAGIMVGLVGVIAAILARGV